MVEEVWKQHHIYDLYEGSTWGRIRLRGSDRVRKPSISAGGYHSLSVRSSTSLKQSNVFVHRFIYSCFNSDFDLSSEYQIDHINDIKADNRLENLQPLTRQENNKKAQPKRDMTKLTSGRVVKIKATNTTTNEIVIFKSKWQCGKYLGKSAALVYLALHNKNYTKHIVNDQGVWIIEELSDESDHD